MLAKLDPGLLDRLSFPLGGLTKDAVRALAREAGLPVADKRESQDLCFVAGLGGRAFLQRHGGPRLRRPGTIVDRDGRVLGRHEGHHNYTVGQRRGLGVATPEPLYVLEKDAATNTRRRRLRGPRSRPPRAARGRHAPPRSRRGRDRSAPLPRAPDSVPCRTSGTTAASSSSWSGPRTRSHPGQLACLMSQDRVVGEGTIGEPR